MLIDVSDIKTIPIEVEKKIWEKFTAMPRSITSKIKAYEIKYNRDVNCAIENYIGPSSAYHFYEELISVFEQYDIVCYHSTKMLDENLILAAGLRTNEWDTYSKNIVNTLQTLGVGQHEIDQAIQIIKRKYDWKYPLHGREPQLCFYSDTGILSEDTSAGYGKVDKKILDTDCMTINIGHMGINNGFIYERE